MSMDEKTEFNQPLIDHDGKGDMASRQGHAAREGNLQLLENLVEKGGPCIPVIDLASVTHDFISRGHLDTLRYLVNGYGLAVNGTFPSDEDPRNHTNLLHQALELRRADSIRLLLEEGADPQCPGLRQTALDLCREQVTANGRDDIDIKDIRIIKLLLTPDASVSEEQTNLWPFKSNLISSSLSLDKHAQKLRKQFKLEDDAGQNQTSPTTQNDYSYSTPYPVLDNSNIVSFQHRPMAGVNSIRVIELYPSSVTERPIHCRISEVNLSEKPEYEALSYVWGDASRNVSIIVDSCQFQITSNLWSALFRLRRKTKSRFLWVDAICINQDLVEERNQQVTMMSEIYKNAQRVVIWLGEHADNSEYVMRRAQEEGESQTISKYSKKFASAPRNRTRKQALQKMTQRPWFFRTWTIQELCLGRNPIVVCGPHEEDFTALNPDFKLRSNCPDFVEGSWQFRCLFFLLYKDPNYIIHHARLCQARDPRDQIYGILGLFDEQFIPVDYSLSVVEVYRRFTQAVIEKSGSLNIFHHLGINRSLKSLPSWVPDYTSRTSLSGPGHFPDGSIDHRLPELRFSGSDLIIKGKSLDVVQVMSDELVAGASRKPGGADFARVVGQWEILALELKEKGFCRSIADAFGNTLIASNPDTATRNRDDLSDYAKQFIAWYHVYGTGPLRLADPDYFNTLQMAYSWSSCKYSCDNMECDVKWYDQKMADIAFDRRFFTTKNGTMGLASPSARHGDQIVYLPTDGCYPFIVRRRSDGEYQLVGDCYLYGFDPAEISLGDDPDAKEFILR